MPKETYSKPSDVVASDGRVLVDGPDGVDLAFTPGAAAETGDRLIRKATEASAQERGEEPEGGTDPDGS